MIKAETPIAVKHDSSRGSRGSPVQFGVDEPGTARYFAPELDVSHAPNLPNECCSSGNGVFRPALRLNFLLIPVPPGHSSSDPPDDLFNRVVANGYCIGCGICAAFDPSIEIGFDPYGRYVPTRGSDSPLAPSTWRVCPFADGPDEDALGSELFGKAQAADPRIGRHLANYIGWVTESDFRANGSSGGLVSWLAVELLRNGLVDYVVHVGPVPDARPGEPLFAFRISASPEEIRHRAKSRYYPVEMSGVLTVMLRRPGRYAVVGIPCFIKGLRLACRESEMLKERLRFTLGIVCGHLKSAGFAEMIAWQCGISPTELRSIDFRTKLPDRSANRYGVTVSDRSGVRVTRPMSELFGDSWSHGLFKYKACDFCDDVVGETADISIGDAWLPEFQSDPAGTNILVVRCAELHSIITGAATAGRVHLVPCSAQQVIASQAGGFRHRRAGLAYRLFLADVAQCWRPRKRVSPSKQHLSKTLQRSYEIRSALAEVSHTAFLEAKRRQDFEVFVRAIQSLAAQVDLLARSSKFLRLLRRVRSRLRVFNPFPARRPKP